MFRYPGPELVAPDHGEKTTEEGAGDEHRHKPLLRDQHEKSAAPATAPNRAPHPNRRLFPRPSDWLLHDPFQILVPEEGTLNVRSRSRRLVVSHREWSACERDSADDLAGAVDLDDHPALEACHEGMAIGQPRGVDGVGQLALPHNLARGVYLDHLVLAAHAPSKKRSAGSACTLAQYSAPALLVRGVTARSCFQSASSSTTCPLLAM